MQKMGKWVIGIIVVLAVVIGLGPIFVARFVNKAFTPQKELITAPLKIKATGTVSILNNLVILTTPHGTNHYILVGNQLNKITKQANNMIYVFGTLAKPTVDKINNMVVRAAIDVAQFDSKDFNVGAPLSEEMTKAINQKVKEQVELRAKVLTKLGLKDPNLEVISGKLQIFKLFKVYESKTTTGLLVKDKYGDQYILNGPFKYPEDEYAKLAGKNYDVVVVGEMTTPDPRRAVLDIQGPFMFFSVKNMGIYNNNDDLSELLVQ
jgi:hypothetical protein